MDEMYTNYVRKMIFDKTLEIFVKLAIFSDFFSNFLSISENTGRVGEFSL